MLRRGYLLGIKGFRVPAVPVVGSGVGGARKASSKSAPDAGEDSHTGQYINTITKPFTVTTYARPNVVFTHGKGSYIYDLENREYVDFAAGIAVTCLGHSHPKVSEIMASQGETLMHCSNLYHNLYAGELANKLVTKTLDSGGMMGAKRVFLCNSGTEANEAALKFARKYGKSFDDGKIEIVSFHNGFHGRSMGALSVTANEKYQAPFAPLIPGCKTAEINNIESVKAVIDEKKTCAVIIEPIQGEGGVNEVDAEFLVELKKLCTDNNALLIYDEIQCGLGRSGKLWAHCHLPEQAHPDMLTMAKALGNGFPIGATMITQQVENVLKVGDHGTTYGGNPLGSRIGSYIVGEVSDKEFLAGVEQKADKLVKGLTKIANKYPNHITDIKGKGLLLGVQFAPSTDVATVVTQCREHGLLVISAGSNVLRIVPALNIPNEVIEAGLSVLTKVVDDVVGGPQDS